MVVEFVAKESAYDTTNGAAFICMASSAFKFYAFSLVVSS